MLQYDFDESLGYWLTQATRDLRRAMEAELSRQNVTWRQWEVLAWLALEKDLSQCELAERIGVEPPTMAGIVDRMERDGLLERVCCTQDRRKKRIRPTAHAEAVWSKMADAGHRVREVATAGITAEEKSLIKDLCQRIRNNVAGMIQDRGIDPCGDHVEVSPEQSRGEDLVPAHAPVVRVNM